MLDTIWWEVDYTDGTTEYEHRGLSYDKIKRDRLLRFRLADAKGPLLVLETDQVRTGWNLCWRRRTVTFDGRDRHVFYVAGWVPMGPILAVNQNTGEFRQADMFIPGDPVFYPPRPNLAAGEKWTVKNPVRVVDPSAEVVG